MKRNANGSVRCTFQAGSKVTDVTADRVVLALPFTTLRDADLTQSGFSSVKLRTISELGLGANAKIHVGVSRRPWVEQGFGGAAYTNLSGFQCGWDDSVNAPLPSGAFVFFPGGRQVSDGWSGATHGTAPAAQVSAYLAQLEPMFPGVTAAYTGRPTATSGGRTRGPRAPTPASSRASTRRCSAPAPCPRATCTSPASTPASRTSATSTVPSRPANAPPGPSPADSGAPDPVRGGLAAAGSVTRLPAAAAAEPTGR